LTAAYVASVPPNGPPPPARSPDGAATTRLRALGFGTRTELGADSTVGPIRHRWWRGLDARGALVVLLVAFLGVVLAGWVLWRARPPSVDAGPAMAVLAPGTSLESHQAVQAATTPSGRPELVVDVEGTVRRPGVVTLPGGSRVRDALAAAGGLLPGASTTSVNLAEPLSDGEQIVLGGRDGPAVGGRGSGAAAGAGGRVNLNSATESDLEGLPGVGPVTAQRILEFRRAHGRFSSVDELREVPGIGPAKFTTLRPRVRV